MKLRARRQEDKAERMDRILSAAGEILARRAPDELTMSEVAQRAGIVKGTIYLYFRTKNELLAASSERTLAESLDAVDRALQKRRRWTLDTIAALLADRLPARDSLIRMVRRDRLATTAKLIAARVPTLGRGESMRFLLCTIAMLLGLRSMKGSREFRAGAVALAHGMEKRR